MYSRKMFCSNKLNCFVVLACIFLALGVVAAEDTLNVVIKAQPGEIESVKSIIGESAVYGDVVAAEVSWDEIKKLEESGAVRRIETVPIFSAQLQDSVGIVNASNAWNLQVSGINLTGIGETVCVVDTGANFSHPALIGKNLTCNIDCYNQDCAEECSVSDDNGHGTHVAGTVAASSGINGIALGASLISLKVLDSDGDSHPTTGSVDIAHAIDWCVSNRIEYNISVITMSLGTVSILFSDYCDSSFTNTITRAINNATRYNITVTAASGNSGGGVPRSTTQISAPACIQNATAVSATNKDDSIASYAHYNSLVELIAPGTSINSTWLSGYAVESGTSMSTPHVAAAFALVRGMYKFQTGIVYTPSQIKTALKNNGKIITGSGLSFSRIDLYSTVLSLDLIAPNVTLVYPENDSVNQTEEHFFSCNASDWQLGNITFYLWNDTGLEYSETQETLGFRNASVFNYTLLPGSYKWSCEARDLKNNLFMASNFSFGAGGVSAYHVSPANNNYTNNNLINFSCNSASESSSSLSNITFYLWNETSLEYNETREILGFRNSSVFNYTFIEEGRYLWACRAVNNQSNYSLSSNFSIVYDSTSPDITLISPSSGTSSTTSSYNFTFNVSDNFNSSYCELVIDNSVWNSVTYISDYAELGMYNVSISVGAHTWRINCTDLAGNTGNSTSRSLTVENTPISQSASPGGGGSSGGSVPSTNSVNKSKNKTSESLTPGTAQSSREEDENEVGSEVRIDTEKIERARYFYIGLYIVLAFGVLLAGYEMFRKFRRGLKVKLEVKWEKGKKKLR